MSHFPFPLIDNDEETVSVFGATAAPLESIAIVIRAEDSGFFAENEELSIFGFGATQEESIKDFLSSLTDKWNGLKDHSDYELTQDAIKIREVLERYFCNHCDTQSQEY